MKKLNEIIEEADKDKALPNPDNVDVGRWLAKIDTQKKEEADYRKLGKEILKIFEANSASKVEKDKGEWQYNILFSNTDTMMPALYSQVPRPVVQRTFNKEDPLAKAGAKLMQQLLKFSVESDTGNCETFDSTMRQAVLGALLPGRGLTRYRYEAEFETVNPPVPLSPQEPSGTETEGQEAVEGESPDQQVSESYEKVTSEWVTGEDIPWDMVVLGPGWKWNKLPWLAIYHYMTKEELKKEFGEEVAELVKLTGYVNEEDGEKADKKEPDCAIIIEVWDKTAKKVMFLSEGYTDAPLKRVEDPLDLQGFFPTPEPLQFIPRIKSMVPVALYSVYKDQAEELNRITSRLKYLIAALKVRGGYDSTIEGMDKILEAEDNSFVEITNVASLQDGKNLENSIWMIPVEKIAPIVQQLYQQRDGIKSVIFELTGLADIMRGSSQASETLGAQQLKNQWGTLRLKNSQKAVQTYAKRCMRLMGEIAVTKFSPETVVGMTGTDLPREADKQQAQVHLQQIQQQMMMQQQASQQPPAMTGQPPVQPQPPAQPDPQLQAQLQQLEKIINTPSLEEVLAMLKNDLTRTYKIDIETNSTVDAAATEDKKDMGELMAAISQFMNGMGPLVQSGTMPMEVVKAFLLSIIRMYRFGDDVEDMIKALQQPTPPKEDAPKGPSPEVLQAQNQVEQTKAKNSMQLMQMEMEAAHADHKYKMDEMARKALVDEATHKQKMDLAAAQHTQRIQTALMKPQPPKPSGR